MNFRHALRTLTKEPGFALVAVMILAIGIGSATAIFSVIESIMLRPLPYGAPERLVMVWGTEGGEMESNFSGANLLDFEAQNQVFEGLTGFFPQRLTWTGADEPEQLRAVEVTPNFFEVMSVPMALGRSFSPEPALDGGRELVLSHELWVRRFGSDGGAAGRSVTLNRELFTIVGVAPAGFELSFENAEVWTRAPKQVPVPPVDYGMEAESLRGLHWLNVIGRLRSGVALAQAQTEMEVIAARLAEAYPDSNKNRGVHLVPLYEQIVGDIRPAMFVLLGAVGMLLLIGCANVANLLLARGSSREREIAIRAALGASRGRLVGQLLTESLLLALFGGLFGVLLAHWATRLILTMGPDTVFRIQEAGLSLEVLAFSLGLSLVTGLLFGILPALQASRPDLQGSLKQSGRGSAGGASQRLRSLLVASEVGLALILLVGAGLLIKSFFILQNVPPGFDPENLLTLRLWLNDSKYEEPGRIASTYTEVLERLGSLPGVRVASGVLGVPLSGTSANFGVLIEGRPAPSGEEPEIGFQSVATDYFRTMGIPLLRGRDVQPSDDDNAPKVAVINETAARRFWPDEDPVGKRFSLGDEDWIEVVGVAGDVRHYGLETEPRAETYLPYRQAPFPLMTFVLRTEQAPLALSSAARQEIFAVVSDLPVDKIRTMEQFVAASVSQPRFHSLLLAIFAGSAILLAAVGIYGLMSYSIGQRQHEIGIRMALGADPRRVLRLVVRQGLLLTAGGLVAGLVGALALSRLLSQLLFQVSSADPLTYAGVASLLFSVSLLATYLPARRASRVDPLVALRHE